MSSTVSLNFSEFNEPEFEEYDPTPYGGGYDLSQTYGQPLPPSDAICYPRSVPQSDSMSLENFSYASIPSPYGKDDDLPTKPPKGSKPVDAKPQLPTVENGDKVAGEGADVETVEPSDAIPSNDSPAYEHQNGFENGTRGDYGYESERQETHIPYGSGLETLDLCDSIFGYWPCLAKIERNRYREVCNQERKMDPWESAVDYLFGNPMVYDFENHHHHHHHQEGQYECYENSWL
ncbi:hypothetical protein CDL12_28798 [Handroanthus impetiginosus]|uniref:Uncharacterized protein n=1 Tax=Handroanthus impetiginosus TaxID=429701 RepID=A0A2G9G0B2_9LAMI|nr:hypothetical protein CDL12_28798 [Handroanthus impetiginosus]